MINFLKVNYEDEELCPRREHEGDAGLDLRASEGGILYPKEAKLIGTGVIVEIPYGFVGQVYSRSGMAKFGVTLANSVGIIDSGYRGEIKVFLINHSNDRIFHFNKGDRIAQLVIVQCALPEITYVKKVTESIRGEGGFGSTGKV